MSKLEVDAIEPQSGTTLTIGASGDSVNIASGATITDFTSTGIDDNATSTAITIDSSENVGIGTSSPSRNLHINASQPYLQLTSAATGTGTLDGFQLICSSSDGEAILMQRENAPMSFYTNGTERMRIESSGNVGIGTAGVSTTARLAVTDSKTGTEASPHIAIGGNGYGGFHWLDTSAYYIGQNSNSRSLRIYSGSNEAVGAQLGAGGTSFGTYSDERLKKDITDLTNGLNKILALRPVNFKYKSDADDYRNRIGIIAQSIVGQVDEALDQTKITADDETQYYNVRYQDLIPVLVKGMQEQQTKIEELEARITALETPSNP